VCAVEAATGRSAINVGKPSLTLSGWIMEEYKLMGEETMMVGDRLDTDMKFGNTGGMKISALVLTGCAKATDIEELLLNEERERDRDMIPTIIFPHVGYIGK
jgi:ribonucleotide monophosphatase NagD (HAD superfamily)